MKKLLHLSLALMAALFILSTGCDDDDSSSSSGSGTLVFTANGEGFVDEGFTSEDGWDIQFDHVYMNIEGPTAYQVAETSETSEYAAHAGHPHASIPEGAAHVALTGEYFIDLKQATAGDPVFEIGSVTGAAVGNYNYLNFNLRNVHTTGDDPVEPTTVLQSGDTATEPSDYEGYCMILIGTATYPSGGPATTTVNFTIKFDQQMAFSGCGPQEDLDEDGTNDGILTRGGTARTQMTFHFDHVFGDIDENDESEVFVGEDPNNPEYMNFWAVGFGPFAYMVAAADAYPYDTPQAGTFDDAEFSLAEMIDGTGTDIDFNVYFHLYTTLKTLGHLGECHCGCEDYDPDAE
ncbi:MAG TPA: hypothetical protein PK926_14280 [Spirochaetota bacterium]|mgnify:CR=1 FL=1|nr:hypothetical protein [Spirochaetota bacterium]HPI90673.1 hypothetical protein [Spirochaetota bacterium]HPR49174.1 hypothetical protein [Spirochaetota bacterium]